MKKYYATEAEGQREFFSALRLSDEIESSNYTDGVYKGTLFEFKKTIPDYNKTLFQAIKYLSRMRIRGCSIPGNILLVALNEQRAYLFCAEDFIEDIEKVYVGPASRNNDDFKAPVTPEEVDYSNVSGIRRLTEILETVEFVKVHIDIYDVVGWSERYYR